ncbi:hypothetical protein GCM10028805_21590 [Spirosoma harenae]
MYIDKSYQTTGTKSPGMNITDPSLHPPYRRLRGYAFDPSFANRLDAFGINTVVYPIRWEPTLQPGPIGEYIEVIDIDPASSAMYPPVDLDDAKLLAQDGLPPSESNPQFHQQMVYAVAMLTIQNFEKALGRPVQWSSTEYDVSNKQREKFVKQLRLYPHAFRDANAYYSSQKKAVLFGYFSARPSDSSLLMPGSLVFSCLSHDIITHEVTHALIDGIYKRYVLPVHEDTLALHEAFSDIVALFQHFTFPEILESQIARTRGNLGEQQWLSQLAQQFGLAIGQYNALREAIGRTKDGKPIQPDPNELAQAKEPHRRGSILVAAIFDAFINIYNRRTADLYRIATDGRGILPDGEIHPDLVRRLASEASRTAKQFLSLCIRALDYCPPVGTTFGELLRAMITADVDIVPNDPLGYRVALIESFKRWGIYPIGIRTLSVENLSYPSFSPENLAELIDLPFGQQSAFPKLIELARNYYNETSCKLKDREALFNKALKDKIRAHGIIARFDESTKQAIQDLTGIMLVNNPGRYQEFCQKSKIEINQALFDRTTDSTLGIAVDRIFMDSLEDADGNILPTGKPSFEIHSLNRAQRVGPDYNVLNQVIITIMQRCQVKLTDGRIYEFKGGSTLIIDVDQEVVRFVHKGVLRRFRNEISAKRLADELLRRYSTEVTEGESPFALSTWPDNDELIEPFALLHRHP